MSHALAKLVLEADPGTDLDGDAIAKVQVQDMYASGTWTIADNSWYMGETDLADYTFTAEMYPYGTEQGKSYALDAYPYLTFTADNAQTFTMNAKGGYTLDESLQYSVNGGEWQQLTAGTAITFGGNNGTLRLRGKSANGTATDELSYARVSFGDSNVPIACSDDSVPWWIMKTMLQPLPPMPDSALCSIIAKA